MKLEKLPSGSYRVRMTINGKQQAVTFKKKPSETEVLLAFSEKVKGSIGDSKHIPFSVASAEYLKSKKNVLSPTTYRGYVGINKNLSDAFLALYIDEIRQLDIQMEINTQAEEKSPKTVRNYHGFISAVLGMFRPEFVIKTTLPQKQIKKVYIPSDEILKKLIEESKTRCNGRYLIPILLGTYGLRRSEVCALTLDDIEGNNINITKAKVQDYNNKWVIKEYLKNDTSCRTIPVSDEIIRLIKEQGYVYNGHPGNISGFISDFCKENDIPNFSLHKLRHFFCSRLSSEHIDTETIMALGGWKSDFVLRNIYRHKVTEKVKEASEKLTSIINLV